MDAESQGPEQQMLSSHGHHEALESESSWYIRTATNLFQVSLRPTAWVMTHLLEMLSESVTVAGSCNRRFSLALSCGSLRM